MNRYKVTLVAHTQNCVKALGASSKWKRTADNTFEHLEDAGTEASAISSSAATLWNVERKDFDIRTEKLGAITYGVVEILWRETRQLAVFTSQRRAYEYARDFPEKKVKVAVAAVNGMRVDDYPSPCTRDTLVTEGFSLFDWADKVMSCSETYSPTIYETWNDEMEFRTAILDASEHEKLWISSIPEDAIGWMRLSDLWSKTIRPNSDGKYLAIHLGERKIGSTSVVRPSNGDVLTPASLNFELWNLEVKIEPLIMRLNIQKRLDCEYDEKFAQWK